MDQINPPPVQPRSHTFEEQPPAPGPEGTDGSAPHDILVPPPGEDGGGQAAKVEAVPFSASQFPMHNAEEPQRRKRRRRSPGLKWYKHYDGPDHFKNGRVLVIDYIKQEQSKQGMRKVAAQEFDSINGLKHLYSTPARVGEPLLRVIHCQNADWATRFLLHKFNINARDDLVGTDFGKWLKYKRPERRGGKPYLNGKTWKTTHDPWRGISRSSFGLDYLKYYKCLSHQDRTDEGAKEKMFELNHYDEDDSPKYGFDVFVQRISCYIQHKETIGEVPDYPGIESPYDLSRGPHVDPQTYVPLLDKLDNGNVIIIFENSPFNSPWDTLISAREQWEARWRRLPFYLGVESHDLSSNDSMSLECMKIILSDIWKSISDNWETFLDVCNTHISILEDKIYDGPADESRAPELWSNSNMWLKVERLVGIHLTLSREMQTNLRELTGDPQDVWLEQGTDDMKKLTGLVQDDLVKPTANLADLMYKSVEIRDSRHSLQLNTSLWRLSWITFIFLPLSFLSSFFGMNVDIFQPEPNIKYYFASAVPLMVLVTALWYLFKHSLANQRQTPYQRGIYEEYFFNLANAYPKLWSRSGPREGIKPQTRLDKLRWRLIRLWNDPEKTVRKTPGDDTAYEDLDTWQRFKRFMTSRWTSNLRSFDDFSSSATTLETGVANDDVSTLEAKVSPDQDEAEVHSTSSAPAAPETEGRLAVPYSETIPAIQPRIGLSPQRPSSEPRRTSVSQASSSGEGNSGIMVEEEPETWLKDYAPAPRRGNTYY